MEFSEELQKRSDEHRQRACANTDFELAAYCRESRDVMRSQAQRIAALESQLAAQASEVEVSKFAVGDKVVTYTALTMGGKDEHQFTVRRIERLVHVLHPDGYQMLHPFQESHLVKVEDIPNVLAALVNGQEGKEER